MVVLHIFSSVIMSDRRLICLSSWEGSNLFCLLFLSHNFLGGTFLKRSPLQDKRRLNIFPKNSFWQLPRKSNLEWPITELCVLFPFICRGLQCHSTCCCRTNVSNPTNIFQTDTRNWVPASWSCFTFTTFAICRKVDTAGTRLLAL